MLVKQPRRKPPGARRSILAALRGLSTVFIMAGGLLLADAGLTVAWQEPVSAIYAKYKQDQLADDLEELELEPLARDQLRALRNLDTERRRVAFLARQLRRNVDKGDAIGRIKIPSIDVNKVVVAGTDTKSLRKGPGHYPETPMPGAPGTSAIAGHRTTYGAPFRKLDDVEKGDKITLETPYAKLTYTVEGTRIVKPSEVSVLRRVGFDRLVLSACHPLYSAAERIVAFAKLSSVEARGAALLSAWPPIKREGRPRGISRRVPR